MPPGLYYFRRVVAPLQPRTIVLYFGENDISNDGLSSDMAFSDFLRLQEPIRSVRSRLPDLRAIGEAEPYEMAL